MDKMEYRIDKEGNVINDKGEKVVIDGNPITVVDVQTTIDSAVKERLARQEKKLDDQIKSLEEQAGKTAEVQKLLNEMKSEKEALEKQLKEASEKAHKEIARQLNDLTKRASAAESELEETRKKQINTEVTYNILSTVGNSFINPLRDVVPFLISVHKREPVIDETTGKPVPNQFVDLFEMTVKKQDGKEEKVFLPLDKAVKVFSEDPNNKHYLRGFEYRGTGKPGGVQYVAPSFIGSGSSSEVKKSVDKIRSGLLKGELQNTNNPGIPS